MKRYGADAMLDAAERADQLLDEGDMAGAETWHRMILNAIERLQAKAPADGEKGALGRYARERANSGNRIDVRQEHAEPLVSALKMDVSILEGHP